MVIQDTNSLYNVMRKFDLQEVKSFSKKIKF